MMRHRRHPTDVPPPPPQRCATANALTLLLPPPRRRPATAPQITAAKALQFFVCDGGAGGGKLFGEAGAAYIFFLNMELIQLYVRREKHFYFVFNKNYFDCW
jgi:hypothetical protein